LKGDNRTKRGGKVETKRIAGKTQLISSRVRRKSKQLQDNKLSI
jgi:hypothetical protein